MRKYLMLSSLTKLFANEKSWVPASSRKLTIYVGWPLKKRKEWKKIESYSKEKLHFDSNSFVSPKNVGSYLLVYPNGEVLTGSNLFHPLPEGIKFLEPVIGAKEPLKLDFVQVNYGSLVCKVNHGRFRKEKEGKIVYATTLHNVSDQKIKIIRFAGFLRRGDSYILHTVTGDFYSSEQFVSWYAAPEDGWILPGSKVTDESNYGGGDSVWAYFGHTEDGMHFIAIDKLPNK